MNVLFYSPEGVSPIQIHEAHYFDMQFLPKCCLRNVMSFQICHSILLVSMCSNLFSFKLKLFVTFSPDTNEMFIQIITNKGK